MVAIVVVLLILWRMPKLTLWRLILVAALVAYPGTFLLSYLQPSDAGAGQIFSSSLIAGTVNFILFVTTGGIIFRKRISQSIQNAEGPQADSAAEPDTAPDVS